MMLTTDALLVPDRVSVPRRVGRRDAGGGPAVAIIGAGFSGTMAAIHLRRVLPPDYIVVLFDRTGRFARGPAYAMSKTPHLLNVRSVNMSALPDDPSHFERWLGGQASHWPGEVQTTEVGTFATRRLYGRYLRALLYEEMTLSGGRVRLCASDTVGLTPSNGGWTLHLAGGRSMTAAAVVLAVGNLPSTRPSDGLVFHDPWATQATAGLCQDEPVLIVGTGLTMVDLALGMRAQGFGGPIIALSRRGLVPQRHGPPAPPTPGPNFNESTRRSLPLLLRAMRRHLRAAAADGSDWRPLIDGLRPVTAALWRGLPRQERERFLRHLRPYWDVHRHRMAPGVADAFAALIEGGTLQLKRGRVSGIERLSGPGGPLARVSIRDHGAAAADTMEVQRVIHATGIGAGTAQDGLIADLISAGQARTDEHGMGLDVTETLRVIDHDGHPQARLWALGPIVRGVFWECTAVPDIRLQARLIATEMAGHSSGLSMLAEARPAQSG